MPKIQMGLSNLARKEAFEMRIWALVLILNFDIRLRISEWEIGLVGFEPTASWSRTRRSTKLSHSPK
jgi:hypothetical protein